MLQDLADQFGDLTPELRKAAAYVLENPNDVGVSSIREIARVARVKPNTFVRMARSIGFDGYDDFREPFREEIRQGGTSFPDRARWLQSLAKVAASWRGSMPTWRQAPSATSRTDFCRDRSPGDEGGGRRDR